MAHFYLVDRVPDEGGVAVLEGPEAKHAAQVGRVRVGERLLVGDGRGSVVDGTVASAQPARVEVRAETVTIHPRPARSFTLVQALAKGDRDELAVQAATELGVDRVVPWQAERSVSRWQGAKVDKGIDRWRAIVREAVKQSLRPWLPEVAPLASTRDVCALANAGTRVLVLDPRATIPLPEAAREAGGSDVALVVGPEGGVSPGELEQLSRSGAVLVRLGPEVLRTSTAGPAAIAALSALLGRWS